MTGGTRIEDGDALIVVDVQNDFCTGSMAIPDHESILPVINRMGRRFPVVAVTQDWHPAGHVSFASAHSGAKPGGTVEVPYGTQRVFPDHCVVGSWGAELHPELELQGAALILRKGMRTAVDSFSAFAENDRTSTGLGAWLRARGVGRVFLCGLALYGCVRLSAMDSRLEGFPTYIVDDASRSLPNPEAAASFSAELAAAGVMRIESTQFM